MLKVGLDVGEVPSVLAALGSKATIDKVLSKAGDSYVSDVKTFIESGQSFKERTGNLKRSITWLPTANGTVTLGPSAKYALYVERGHSVIKGRRRLKNGRVVNVKGRTKAYPFMLIDTDKREQDSVLAAQYALNEVVNEFNR